MHQAPVVWERWNVAELRWGCYILRYMLGVLWQAWVRFALRAPLSQICDIYMHLVKLTLAEQQLQFVLNLHQRIFFYHDV